MDCAGQRGGRLEEEAVLALLVGQRAVGALEEVVAGERVLVHLQGNAFIYLGFCQFFSNVGSALSLRLVQVDSTSEIEVLN